MLHPIGTMSEVALMGHSVRREAQRPLVRQITKERAPDAPFLPAYPFLDIMVYDGHLLRMSHLDLALIPGPVDTSGGATLRLVKGGLTLLVSSCP